MGLNFGCFKEAPLYGWFNIRILSCSLIFWNTDERLCIRCIPLYIRIFSLYEILEKFIALVFTKKSGMVFSISRPWTNIDSCYTLWFSILSQLSMVYELLPLVEVLYGMFHYLLVYWITISEGLAWSHLNISGSPWQGREHQTTKCLLKSPKSSRQKRGNWSLYTWRVQFRKANNSGMMQTHPLEGRYQLRLKDFQGCQEILPSMGLL